MSSENPNSPINPTPTPLTPPTPQPAPLPPNPSQPISSDTPLPIPSDPPLASPSEPTRLYPSHPSKTYASDPSKYAYPIEGEEEISIDSQDDSSVHGSDVGPKPYERERKNKNKSSWNDSFTQQSKKIEDIFQNSLDGRTQSLTYVILIIGLILMFFNSLIGGLLLGMVAGYHFAKEIFYYVRHLDHLFIGQDKLRYITFTALLLGLFIVAPGIFVGAALVAAFKQVVLTKNDQNYRDPSGQ
jgi:hypothetical protein